MQNTRVKNVKQFQIIKKKGRNVLFAGPREARNPNLDSDQWIASYACTPCL